MNPPLPPLPAQTFFDPLRFWLEVAYVIIVAAMFFFVYWRTRHLFELTKHQGIRYFRRAFLFFACAYLSRIVFFTTRIIVNASDTHIPGRELSFVSLFLVTYLTTIAVGYFIYSNVWKKLSHTQFLVLIHLLAILSLSLFYLRYPLVLFFCIQAGLLVSLLLVNAKKQLRFVYPLMSLFWFLNMVMLFSRRFLGFEVKIFLQLVSIGLLIYLGYRVLRWTK